MICLESVSNDTKIVNFGPLVAEKQQTLKINISENMRNILDFYHNNKLLSLGDLTRNEPFIMLCI